MMLALPEPADWPDLERTAARLVRQHFTPGAPADSTARCARPLRMIMPVMDYLMRDLNPALDPEERAQLIRNIVNHHLTR